MLGRDHIEEFRDMLVGWTIESVDPSPKDESICRLTLSKRRGGRRIIHMHANDLGAWLTMENKRKQHIRKQKPMVDLDLTPTRCFTCGEGEYQETSMVSDVEGWLQCPKCQDTVPRHMPKDKYDMRAGRKDE